MKSLRFKYLIFSFILFYGILGVVFSKVEALTLSPARFEISGDPGETIVKEITLFNDSQTNAETYYVSYSNFEAQGETGSPLFVKPKDGLGTWMNAGDSVTIAPGQSKNIPLVINIPKDAYPGGYFAVVFFGTSRDGEDNSQVSVGAKTGILVLLSVNGDVLEQGGLASFNTKEKKRFFNSLPVTFEYRFKNDGNDRVKPVGNIKIRNIFYYPSAKLNANAVSGNILPHSTRMFSVDWLKYKPDPKENHSTFFISSFFNKVIYQWKNFAIGPYWATIDLVYGSQNLNVKDTIFFFVFPWQLIVFLLVLILIFTILGKKLLKKYNQHIIKQAQISMNLNNEPKYEE